MVPIAALAALGQAGYQYAQAEKQKKKAKDLKPSNYMPAGVSEATQNSRLEANTTMGPSTQRGLEKLRNSTASTIENAKRIGGSPGQIQQTVADTDAREKEALKDLEVSDSAFRGAKKSELNSNLRLQGQYQKMSQDAYGAAKSALIGASEQNKFNAVSGAAEGIIYSLPDSAFEDKVKSQTAGTSTTDVVKAEQTARGLRQADVSKWSGRYPKASINAPFDYRKYMQDMNMKRFSTGY